MRTFVAIYVFKGIVEKVIAFSNEKARLDYMAKWLKLKGYANIDEYYEAQESGVDDELITWEGDVLDKSPAEV